MIMSYRNEEGPAARILGLIGRIIVYVVIGFLLFKGMTRGYAFGHEIFCPVAMEAAPGTDRNVTIEKGSSDSQVAKLLAEKGLIPSEAAFIVQAKLYEYTAQEGTYTLSTSMTSKEIWELLEEGPATEEKDGETDE